MRRLLKYIFLNTVVLFFLINSLNAQQINELQEKKKLIEKDIESITNLISKTEKESNTSLTNIKLTKRRIELKNNLISQIDNESDEIRRQVEIRKNRIDSLGVRIEIIKNEYRRLIVYSQRNKNSSNNLLLQIFSAQDFNQAYKRIKFYQQVLNYKKQIVDNYKNSIVNIKYETNKLSENINLLAKKQKEKESEVNALKKEELTYKQKVEKLGQKKKQLLVDLEDQKRVSKKLNDEIKKLIEEEARKEVENAKKVKASNVNMLTLSNNFKENIGRFNLPVENGVITGTYGESFHPILKEVKVKNNGIDITVSTKTQVNSIFNGEVRKIIKIPGSNLAVIIRHGSFLSVYANLSIVNVSVGQEVKTYQKIGEINLQKGEETAILHFELWNESKTEDPIKWFKR